MSLALTLVRMFTFEQWRHTDHQDEYAANLTFRLIRLSSDEEGCEDSHSLLGGPDASPR